MRDERVRRIDCPGCGRICELVCSHSCCDRCLVLAFKRRLGQFRFFPVLDALRKPPT